MLLDAMARRGALNKVKANGHWFNFASVATKTLPSLSSPELHIPEVQENSDGEVSKGLDYFDKFMAEDGDSDSDIDDELWSSISTRKRENSESLTRTISHMTSSSSSTSLSSSSSASCGSCQRQRSVTFSTVEIREYCLVVDDNPLCHDGLSMSLDKEFNQETTIVDVESYEAEKIGDDGNDDN